MYDTLATDEMIQKTAEALRQHNFEPIIVSTKAEALEKIKELIPKDASVINGSSKTLIEIGFIDYLKSGEHGWNNLHAAIATEADPIKQKQLRKQAMGADYYLGSVHALSETGEMVIASNTGSQLPNIVYGSDNLIFVVGAQKIAADLDSALSRLKEYVVPLENERMTQAHGMGTTHSKTLIYHKEATAITGRKIRVLIVKEKLGF